MRQFVNWSMGQFGNGTIWKHENWKPVDGSSFSFKEKAKYQKPVADNLKLFLFQFLPVHI